MYILITTALFYKNWIYKLKKKNTQKTQTQLLRAFLRQECDSSILGTSEQIPSCICKIINLESSERYQKTLSNKAFYCNFINPFKIISSHELWKLDIESSLHNIVSKYFGTHEVSKSSVDSVNKKINKNKKGLQYENMYSLGCIIAASINNLFWISMLINKDTHFIKTIILLPTKYILCVLTFFLIIQTA